ncbi:hypothetical protein BH23CHL8_BH23CHL8_18860 [soil metagenome]
MVPWSPRLWLERIVGCPAEQLRLVARSDVGDTSLVTYETPAGERITVLAVLEGGRWRVSARHDGRWRRADVLAGREVLW